MGLQGKGESSKFEVWMASLRLGGVLEERVTACHGVSGGGQLPAYVRERSLFWDMSVSPACRPPSPSPARCMSSPAPQLDPL